MILEKIIHIITVAAILALMFIMEKTGYREYKTDKNMVNSSAIIIEAVCEQDDSTVLADSVQSFENKYNETDDNYMYEYDKSKSKDENWGCFELPVERF